MLIRTLTLALAITATTQAQQPKITNAQLTTSSTSLQQTITQTQGPTWLAYTTPTVREVQTGGDNKLYLEGDNPGRIAEPKRKPSTGVVLLRIEAGKITRIRLNEPTREIDAGGLPVIWLTSVSATASLNALQSAVETGIAHGAASQPSGLHGAAQAEERLTRRILESGLMVIALTDMPEATTILEGFTAPKYPPTARERAAFWLASARGREGFNAIEALLHTGDTKAGLYPECDDNLRAQLVNDLMQVHADPATNAAALEELLTLAKSGESFRIRSEAQSRLAEYASQKDEQHQATDPRIAQTLSQQAAGDSDFAISKSAIDALARLPEDQGIPKLIALASNTQVQNVRREAIRRLGQTKDPRALAYLEKVVKE